MKIQAHTRFNDQGRMQRGFSQAASVKRISFLENVKQLVKFRLTLTVVFSSMMAFIIASGGTFEWTALLLLAAGGFFIAGSANAFNQILEREYDRQMERTAQRPLASGRMAVSEATVIAGIMCLFGIIMLAFFNPLTAFLGMLSLVIYAFIYTPLKRFNPVAVAVGAIPGALPAMIGCVAATGEIGWLAIILFSIQFLWQFPHFWAIGWLAFDQYQKAGFNLIPALRGKVDRNLGLHATVYAGLLIPFSVLAFAVGVFSPGSAVVVGLISLGFTLTAWRFHRNFERKSAKQLMFYSLVYLPIVLVIIAIGAV